MSLPRSTTATVLVAATGLLSTLAWLLDSGTGFKANSGPLAVALVAISAVLAAGVLCLRSSRALVAPVLAALATSAGIAVTGDGGDALAVAYVPIVLYAAYFLPPRLAVAIVALIAIGYAAALARRDLEAPALAWGVVVTATALTTTTVIQLRTRSQRLLDQLAIAASRDALTGLWNRRHVEERLDEELQRTRRTSQPLSVMLGDLDRFKELNDGFGHAAGDAALRTLAQALADATRRTDTVGRFGGDEFVIILPDTDNTGALEHAQRLARTVRQAVQDAPVPLTISFGVATIAHAPWELDRDALLAEADSALYEAKRRRGTDLRAPADS